MFSLILAWTVGVIVRFLLAALQDPMFNVKNNVLRAVAAIVIGGVVAWGGQKANLTHWIVYAAFICGGFLTKYIIEKLTKIKG